jgi:hypothetical protein
VGTSSSYRSPQTPRWRAFNRALDAGLPLERVSVQLFLAGEVEWRSALDNPALATFAETLVDAHAGLSEQLAAAKRPAPVISAFLRQARAALFEEDFSVALPVAERAMRTVLMQTLQSTTPLAETTGRQAAEAWERNRGAPEELVHRFVGQLFGHWAAHVAARDTARLVDFEGPHTSAIGKLNAELSSHVSRVAEDAVQRDQLAASDLGGTWQQVVDAVFEAGRRLEPADDA